MFFEKTSEIPTIAARTSCTIFVVPSDTKLKLKNPLILQPDGSKTTNLISVEQIRDFIAMTNHREANDRFFVISPADAMNEAAQNAFLKTFEEPKEHCHFILLTEQPASLLPTIRSRAQIFFPKIANVLDQPPRTKAKTMTLAKKLISIPPVELPALATELTKNKSKPREQALEIVGTAIELLYKSYFKTGSDKFLTKLPNFLKLYESLNQNGHIKLHLVADFC